MPHIHWVARQNKLERLDEEEVNTRSFFDVFFFLQEARGVFHETGLVTDKSLALLAGGARWRCGEQ
jgi:hypothetical protein